MFALARPECGMSYHVSQYKLSQGSGFVHRRRQEATTPWWKPCTVLKTTHWQSDVKHNYLVVSNSKCRKQCAVPTNLDLVVWEWELFRYAMQSESDSKCKKQYIVHTISIPTRVQKGSNTWV